jgi:hypothetical protein
VNLVDSVRACMEAHWRPEGFTVPHAMTYPWRWLWDSCFHSLIWLALGDADRAARELAFALSVQDDDGFVAHLHYVADPSHHAAFWGRPSVSTISQPPVAGHAVATLERAGVDVPAELRHRAERAVSWWWRARRHEASGLVAVRHPWETGCDDSARFDHWGAADTRRWFDVKGDLVASGGAGFDCAPAGLSALVAWDALELGLDPPAGLLDALASRWDDSLGTWVDAGDAAATSGRTRTLDGLLPLLVLDRPAGLDLAPYLAAYGPRGMHPGEPAYEPDRYWRGGVWPQLAYLLWRAGVDELAAPTVRGARRSGLAEWWHPDTAAPGGAVPQSWTGLALLMS